MTVPWNSSPVRDLATLEATEERQMARAQHLYRPMSSPLKQRTTSDGNGQKAAKQRYKEFRDQKRQRRLELSREKLTEIQNSREEEEELLRQAVDAEVDIEYLIDVEARIKEEASAAEAREQYELEELELLLAQEQAELELHFSKMQIQNT